MRTAGLPTFRKLWGKIDEILESGNYVMTIDNREKNLKFYHIFKKNRI